MAMYGCSPESVAKEILVELIQSYSPLKFTLVALRSRRSIQF